MELVYLILGAIIAIALESLYKEVFNKPRLELSFGGYQTDPKNKIVIYRATIKNFPYAHRFFGLKGNKLFKLEASVGINDELTLELPGKDPIKSRAYMTSSIPWVNFDKPIQQTTEVIDIHSGGWHDLLLIDVDNKGKMKLHGRKRSLKNGERFSLSLSNGEDYHKSWHLQVNINNDLVIKEKVSFNVLKPTKKFKEFKKKTDKKIKKHSKEIKRYR